jgi:cytochrome b involved in lipid metabolism
MTANPPTPTFLRGEDVPSHLIKVTPSMLKPHNGRKGNDAWSVWQGRVYNVTRYGPFHPGGQGELFRGAGKIGEAERLFNEVHSWISWDGMLKECMVGIMVGEEEGRKESELDDMD